MKQFFSVFLVVFFVASGCADSGNSENNGATDGDVTENTQSDGDSSENEAPDADKDTTIFVDGDGEENEVDSVEYDNTETDTSESVDESDSEITENVESELTDGDSTEEESDVEKSCEPYTRTCFGNSVFVCNKFGTGYDPPINCGTDQFCQSGVCQDHLCTPDEVACHDNTSYKVCMANGAGYGDILSCGAGFYCRLGECKQMVCEPDEKGCLGNAWSLCASDGSGWGTTTSCTNDQFCKDGSCLAQVCTPGEWSCDGTNARRKCKTDGSGLEDPVDCGSDKYCEGGLCKTQVCKPLSTTCEGNGVKTCNALGSSYDQAVPCESGKLCIEGVCLDTMCTPGTKVCGGDSVLTCLSTGDGYSTPVACGDGKYCYEGSCLGHVCTPNERTCDTGKKKTCNENGSAWNDPVACKVEQYCDGGYCYDHKCEPGSTICEDNDSVKTCKSDGSGYEIPVGCGTDKVCVTDACIDTKCVPSTLDCEGNSVVVCNATGTGYNTPTPCGNDKYCDSGVCYQQVCTPDVSKCEQNSVATCDSIGSAWGDPVSCGAEYYCSSGACHPWACTPDAKECSGDFAFHVCEADGSDWGGDEQCGSGKYCDQGSCKAQACTPGESECITDTSLRECNSQGSAWLIDEDCLGNYVCEEGKCYDPSDLPDTDIQVNFVSPAPGETVQLTQGEDTSVSVNAFMTGGSITSVEFYVDDELQDTDTELPYQFDFAVPASADTGTKYELLAKAHGNNGRFNNSQPVYVEVRNDPPVADFTAVVTGPGVVEVNAGASSDRESDTANLEVRWDWDNDDVFDTDWTTTKTDQHTYSTMGTHTIQVEVKDEDNQTDSTTRTVNFSTVMDVYGEVTSTTWYGTVNVRGDTWVPAGETLTISAGTNVIFLAVDNSPMDGIGDYDLVINGSIVVEGTAANPVTFTASAGNTVADSWNMVKLSSTSSGNFFEYAIFEYAHTGLDMSAPAAISDCEFRFNNVGIKATNTSEDIMIIDTTVRDSLNQGIYLNGAEVDTTGMLVYDNGSIGIDLKNGEGSKFTDCIVSTNGTHGFKLTGDSADISECEISQNSETGIYYLGESGGTVTHCEIKDNKHEGVRSKYSGSYSPDPTINWNNIYNNGSVSSFIIEHLSNSATTTGSYDSGYKTGTQFNTPSGETILYVKEGYSEYDSSYSNYIRGYIRKSNGNTGIISHDTGSSAKWKDISGNSATGLIPVVYDNKSSYYGNQTIYNVAYMGSVPKQISVLSLGSKVDARFNYFGAWPDVLSVISYSSTSHLDIQGFVGVKFDDNWDKGPYYGGVNLESDETWTGDIYITGNVTLDTGVTLTIAKNTTVHFIGTDQNRDNIGDWRLDQAEGTLDVNGGIGEEVTFTMHGDIPSGGGYQYVGGIGTGSATIENAVLEEGKNGLFFHNGSADLNRVTVKNCHQDGVVLKSSASATIISLTVKDNASSGIFVNNSGETSMDYIVSMNNGEWGIKMTSATNASNALTNSTITQNTEGGIILTGSKCNIGHNNITYNGYGIRYIGDSSGTVEYNNIATNDLDGIYLTYTSSSEPSPVINNNNIEENALDYDSDSGTYGGIGGFADYIDLSAVTDGSYDSGYENSTTYNTNGPKIEYLQAGYSEYDSSYSNYVRGYLMANSSAYKDWDTGSSQKWYDVISEGFTSVYARVYDNKSSYWGNVTIKTVFYHKPVDSSNPLPVELSAVLPSSTLNANGNWWGVDVGITDRIAQAVPGSVDITGSTSNRVPGCGPQ